jgi:tRNA dimethylallyltransferase
LTERPVVVVGGPTAGGKSALALAIAEEFGGTVINADSMQVYRDLPILTAQPDPETLSRAPHKLYGVLDAADKCSAGRWRDLAVAEIEAASDAGRVPIVTGGTGLYLRALVSGLHRMPAVPAELRDGLNARLAAEGPAALHAELARDDPETAARLLPSDSQRIVRALEILVHTGRGQSDWQRGAEAEKPAGLRFLTITLLPPRETLYEACNARFADMLDAGAEDELRRFSATAPPDCPLWKAVGVDPVRRHLAGEIDRDEMIDLGRRDTRRYAKRQLTWLRHQIVTDLPVAEKFSEIRMPEIFSKISIFLLTPS